MEEVFLNQEPVKKQGVEEILLGAWDLPKRVRYSKNHRNQWSFRLKDGRYAYLDYVKMSENGKKILTFYHVLSIDDEEYMSCLDYWDRYEEKNVRSYIENESYAQQNYDKRMADADDDLETGADPVSKGLYLQWVRSEASRTANTGTGGENAYRGRPFPLRAEYPAVNEFVKQMTDNDRRVYNYLFDSNLSEEEIKKEFELGHSAWSMEKARFLEKVRRFFIGLGYDVPTREELKAERDNREKRQMEAEEQERNRADIRIMGKSIARELALIESDKLPSTYVEEDQQLQADYEQMLADDRKLIAKERQEQTAHKT